MNGGLRVCGRVRSTSSVDLSVSPPMLAFMLQAVGDSVCSVHECMEKLQSSADNPGDLHARSPPFPCRVECALSLTACAFLQSQRNPSRCRTTLLEHQHEEILSLCIHMLSSQRQSDSRIESVLRLIRERVRLCFLPPFLDNFLC